MKTKGFKEDLDHKENSSISKSTFEIIKKCLEIDNVLSISEMSKNIKEK